MNIKYHHGLYLKKINIGHYRYGKIEFYRYSDGDLKGLWDIRIGYDENGFPIVDCTSFKRLKDAVIYYKKTKGTGQ